MATPKKRTSPSQRVTTAKRTRAKSTPKKASAKAATRVVKKGAATTAAVPKAANGGERVASSLESLLETLAMDAYTKAEKSGDRESYESEGRDADELYGELWENEYRWGFFSAFLDLSVALRGDSTVRKLTQRAADVFTQKLSDERACFAYCKKHWKTPDRIARASDLARAWDGDLPAETNRFARREPRP